MALTVIVCVVSDVDQLILELIEEVKSTLPPAQNVVGPLAVTIGAGGIGFTVIVIDVLGLVHPNNVCARV